MRETAHVAPDAMLTAREIAEAAGVTVTRRAVSGCAGMVDAASLRIYLNARGHARTQNRDLAHELIHLVRDLNNDTYPHDEARVDWGAVALLMPRRVVLGALGRLGFDSPARLVEAFPEVPPPWVLLRAAWVAHRPVAVHHRGERHVWAPEGYQVPERGIWWEQRLVRDVRTTGMVTRTLPGAVGIPVGDTGADGVLVVYPQPGIAGW